MPLMPEARNALVDLKQYPDPPEVRGTGIAIHLGRQTASRFKVGSPVLLCGAYTADRALVEQCGGQMSTAILLTLIRTDKVFGETARLVMPMIASPVPRGPGIAVPGDNYREGGWFRADLVRFFELPAEAGRYTVQAALGPCFSDRLPFEIVRA